jgi:hypothetical protein
LGLGFAFEHPAADAAFFPDWPQLAAAHSNPFSSFIKGEEKKKKTMKKRVNMEGGLAYAKKQS